MKKFVVSALVAGFISVASAQGIPAGYFGAFLDIEDEETIGVQYTMTNLFGANDLRVGISSDFDLDVVDIAGDVMFPGGPLGDANNLFWNWGAGVSFAFLTEGDVDGGALYPHALAGVEYMVTPEVGVFAEVQGGLAFWVGDDIYGDDSEFDAVVRLGVNFR